MITMCEGPIPNRKEYKNAPPPSLWEMVFFTIPPLIADEDAFCLMNRPITQDKPGSSEIFTLK